METDINIYVNGKLYKVPPEIEGDTRLVTFLRNHVGLKGTKYMCKEGSCGACIVNYTWLHPATNEKTSFAVNSCLVPVISCHNAAITTVEGLGNKVVGYNKVQTALAKFNGSQCGFCSPGMVMNMYSLLSSKSDVTMKDVERSFAGNVCRCTGYRPILDAFKSLSSDATEKLKEKIKDIEDLWKVCQNRSKDCNGCTTENCKLNFPFKRTNRKSTWIVPGSVEDIQELFKGHENYRIVAGNTGEGVYKSDTSYPVYIDISRIPELKNYSIAEDRLELGANMSLTETMSLFNKLAKEKRNFKYLEILADHIQLVANVPVRNVGTLGGNLMIKYYHREFPSDLVLIFETVKASVITVSVDGESRSISIEELYSKDMAKSIIAKIILPALSEEYVLRTFKIMPRAQNAFALVNAAFLFRFDENYCVSEKPNIVYGGISPNFIHALRTEQFLIGKNIFNDFKKATSILSQELDPIESIVASSDFIKQLALNLFYKYVLNLDPDRVNSIYRSGGMNLQRPISQGIQEYETKPENWPLTKPINKREALIQCSGEAEYVNDIPESHGQLYGALVLAEQAPAMIKNVDSSTALAIDGVVAFYSAKDIPGKNIFIQKNSCAVPNGKKKNDDEDNIFVAVPVEEELFCSGKVLYSGQPVGIIIAETENLAYKAARLIKIDYTLLQEPLCLTAKDALKNGLNSKIKPFSSQKSARNINLGKAIYKVEGEVEMGPQYHFTMEPQSCICTPTEDGINIFSSSQWMSCIQGAVSAMLNIPENSINMEVRRIGGGFGAKITRASMVATACTLAAYKLNRPVKVILDIETNMKAIGKRNASYTKYEAGFDAAGFIEWLKVWHYSDEGCSPNDPSVMIFTPALVNCYDSSGWEINLYTVSTSTPSSSWMRAPGTIEGNTAIEEIIEHISFVLKKDPLEVRQKNLGRRREFVDRMITTVSQSSSYLERKECIENFNKLHRWKKKGISLVPTIFDLCYFFSHASMVSIYSHDGTVSVTHGGIEMGQGINTKVIQVCASTLGIDESKIKIKSSSVLTSPNAHMSGASITSDNVVYSTLKCCEILNERLEPVKKQMKGSSWEEIIAKAYVKNINLNASYMFKSQDQEIKKYPVYGAAVTEVEVDILTGQYQILRADLLEDAGESINPEIDIGQIEGGFVMGLGYLLTENIIFDSKTGLTLSNNTSNYWVPGPLDIPIDFRVSLLKNAPNPYGVVRSKATGEPPLCLAVSAVNALRQAIMSAREDNGENSWLQFSQPFSVQKVCQATKVTMENFNF